MTISTIILIFAVISFGGTFALGAALAMFEFDGLMKDFMVLNLIGAAHGLILALIVGLWFLP